MKKGTAQLIEKMAKLGFDLEKRLRDLNELEAPIEGVKYYYEEMLQMDKEEDSRINKYRI